MIELYLLSGTLERMPLMLTLVANTTAPPAVLRTSKIQYKIERCSLLPLPLLCWS